MTRSRSPSSKAARAHAVLLRLALAPYAIHFKSPAYLDQRTLDMLDHKVGKEVLKASASTPAVREAIGTDRAFWHELTALLRQALVSFERRSFAHWDPSGVDYESTSGSLIAAHYPLLWQDLERLHDLLSISRNVLTLGPRAQDLAAATHIDGLVCQLIQICVRVTARGFDGEAGTGDEEKWQYVVGSYKKVLITSLQWVNNFVARNESRRVGMWIRLFEPGSEAESRIIEDGLAKEDAMERQRQETEAAEAKRPEPPINNQSILLAYGVCGSSRLSPLEMEAAQPLYNDEGFFDMPTQAKRHVKNQEPSTWVYFVHLYKQRCIDDFTAEHKRAPMLAEIYKNIPRYWHELIDTQENGEKQLWAVWMRSYGQALRVHRDELTMWEDEKARPKQRHLLAPRKVDVSRQEQNPVDPSHVEQRILELQDQLAERYRTESANMPSFGHTDPVLEGPEAAAKAADKDDLSMPFTADAGAKILESGKLELMKRLEGYPPEHAATITATALPDRTRSLSPPAPAHINGDGGKRVGSDPTAERPSTGVSGVEVGDAFAEDSMDEEEEELEEEEEEEESEDAEEDEEDDEDYPGSSEDGRGLLTDVPLILGPSEIEVLPMLIMSGIVPTSPNPSPTDTPTSHLAEHNIPVLLTHLLLSTPSGLNLLRELLIFVAAWDLREEELYFKFMVKIIEAILQAGLLPYAYHAFRDRSRSRDIISPAQAVVMKLLTCIFRGRASEAVKNADKAERTTAAPTKVELHVLNFIFAEFRQHIIPQTCALIFLQGQIHKGRASPEDFPLNLWDMERMYEGVYQYLEFFAVLTEESQREAFIREEKSGGQDVEDEWSWKKILADWEMSRELVTLLRELEGGIPRAGPPGGSVTLPGIELPPRAQRRVSPPSQPQRSMSADAATMPPPVAVERPYDVPDNNITLPSLPSATGQAGIFEPEHPLAYPDEPLAGAATTADQDEPSDFEWKNLKKLAVLVLSSLVWKQPLVQQQIREAGGLETLVACCRTDANNPWIRDHAIMCLRFATDGNAENVAELRHARNANNFIPREVLDTNGYEAFLDDRGQVSLRRKGGGAGNANGGAGRGVSESIHAITQVQTSLPFLPAEADVPVVTSEATQAKAAVPPPPRLSAATTKMTAERAAELMQNALRDLPLGDRLVSDRQKAEALQKLDRAFESTERGLGKR